MKGVVEEERGSLEIIGIIVLLLVMVLLLAVTLHYNSTAGSQITTITGMLLPLAGRKKGMSKTLLIVVISLLITAALAFSAWMIVDANGQIAFSKTMSNIGDAIGGILHG